MAMGSVDDMPSLDEVMKGADFSPSKNKGGDDDDTGFDVDMNPFSQFADDDSGQLENEERKQTKADEVVFDVLEDDDQEGDQDDDFKDTRKKGDPRKMSRLQREMRAKKEARDALSALNKHVDRIAAQTTEAMRAEMHAKRGMAEIARNTGINNLEQSARDMKLARENGDDALLERAISMQAEARTLISKAEGVIARYPEAEVDRFVFDPRVPQELRDANNGGTSKGKDWIDANAHWFANPEKYGAEIAFAQATDKQLMKEGKFSPESDEYFNELTRRVALNMRNIEVYTSDGRVARVGERQRGGGQQQRRDTTGSSANSGTQQSRRPDNGKERDVITSEERKLFARMGLDLTNKEHLAELKANRVK